MYTVTLHIYPKGDSSLSSVITFPYVNKEGAKGCIENFTKDTFACALFHINMFNIAVRKNGKLISYKEL